MRIVRYDSNYAVMTATASEDVVYRPYQSDFDKQGSRIFLEPDGSPTFPPKPPSPPLLARAYPDREKLVSVGADALRFLSSDVEHTVDQWGRRYVKVYGPFEDAAVRSACNRVSVALGFEAAIQPWTAREEGQEIYRELCMDDSGDDLVLGIDVSISFDGMWHVKD